eukprot:8647344-Lingulodinium_polyedra.AAC.1
MMVVVLMLHTRARAMQCLLLQTTKRPSMDHARGTSPSTYALMHAKAPRARAQHMPEHRS